MGGTAGCAKSMETFDSTEDAFAGERCEMVLERMGLVVEMNVAHA